LYATYRSVDELPAPCFKIIDFGYVGMERFHEIKYGGLGFAQEGHHCDRRWFVIVG
jgi:hypothetical protein